MQVEEFDVYNESCATSMKSDSCEETGTMDDSDDSSIDDDASLSACSSESSINNQNVDGKVNKKPGLVHPKEENDPLGSEANEDFRSIFFNTSNGPTCGKYHFIVLCFGVLQCVLFSVSVKELGMFTALHYSKKIAPRMQM